MKRLLSTFAVLGSLGFLSTSVEAAPCDAVTACEAPAGNGSQASWTPSASGMTAIQSNNSSGPTGNVSSAKYFFAASTTDQGATLAKGSLTTTGDGAEVVGSFSFPSGSTPGSIVFGGVVQNLLGNQAHFFYAQACPGTAALDSALCSSWVRIGSRSTLAYPTDVFSTPVKPTDATINTINGRISVPAADLGNISLVRFTIRDLINAANNQTLAPRGFTGNGTYTINNTEYTQNGGFKPNVKYEFQGKVVYPYGVDVPTAVGSEVETGFWTTPADPFNVTTANVTHCSVQITARNASGAPANPTYTPYRLCATGTCASDQAIGGTGIATDTITRTITGLTPNTSYTPNARAIVGNGSDATASGWNSSAQVNGTGFTTLDWGGTFGITNVGTTTADFTTSGIIGAGSIASWQIILNGSTAGQPSGAGAPPATINLTGLTPNTQYVARIRLTEASGCFSDLPTAGVSFTTTPNVPTSFDLTAPAARQLAATWGTAGNSGSTVYQVQYCLDAGFTTGCATQNSAAGATSISITSGISPETTYFARVRALTVGGGLNSGYSNTDSVTTPNEAPNITSMSCAAPSGPSTTCTAQATDNALPGQTLLCHWTANNGATITSGNDQQTNGTGVCPTVSVSLPGNGSYTVTLEVRDHAGVLPYLTDTDSRIVGVGPVATTIIVSPNAATVATGNTRTFTAEVRDQFGGVIAGASVNWSLSGPAGGTLSVNSGVSTVFTAAAPVGNTTLTASLAGASDGTASITVIAAGAFFVNNPTIVLNSDTVTGNLSTLGGDNVSGEPSIRYTWTLESGPAPVSISPNGTNAAKNALVTFARAGTYVFRATLSNNNGSVFALTPSTTVVQSLTSIAVSPNNITVKTLESVQFNAAGTDQFGAPMSLSNVNWTTTGGASISGAGIFSSAVLGQSFLVRAQSAGKEGVANLTVVNFDVSGAKAYPVPFKSTLHDHMTFSGLGSSAKVRIYTTSGIKVFETETTAGSFDWRVVNSANEKLASGVYFYIIESPDAKKEGKIVIIQ